MSRSFVLVGMLSAVACAGQPRVPTGAAGAGAPADAVNAYHTGFNRGDAGTVRGAIGRELVMAGGNFSGEPRDWDAHQFLSGERLDGWPAWMLREAGPIENRWEIVKVSVRGAAAIVVTRETGRNRFRTWNDETVTWFVGQTEAGWKIVGLFIRDLRNPERERARDVAAAKIRALGGTLEVLEDVPGRLVTKIDLHETAVTDDDLAALAVFTELRTLDLRLTKITDRGLAHLRPLTRLQFVNLFRTSVGDQGLAQLAGMTELETLLVGGTRITDAGMAVLGGLRKLRKVSVFDTGVGDAGVARLIGLPRLEVLLIGKSRVTDAGVRDLRQAIPGLRFSEET